LLSFVQFLQAFRVFGSFEASKTLGRNERSSKKPLMTELNDRASFAAGKWEHDLKLTHFV
jgi:hypothetical protein